MKTVFIYIFVLVLIWIFAPLQARVYRYLRKL